MTDYHAVIDSGEVILTGNAPDGTESLQGIPEEATLILTAIGPLMYYPDIEQPPVVRPVLPTTVSLVVDGVFTLSGLDSQGRVIIKLDGEIIGGVQIDSSTFTFSSAYAGSFTLEVEAWPYQSGDINVTVSA